MSAGRNDSLGADGFEYRIRFSIARTDEPAAQVAERMIAGAEYDGEIGTAMAAELRRRFS